MTRIMLMLSLWMLASVALADAAGKACSIEWDAVVDPRVTGYRLYADDAMLTETTATTITCDAAKVPKKKQVKLHVTAFGAGEESAPSNALELYYDDSPLGAPRQFRVVVMALPKRISD